MARVRATPSDTGRTGQGRRALLIAAALLPAGLLVERAAAVLGAGAGAVARAGRPSALGTSATRCAACGATDHTMLDPRCPFALRARDTGQG